MIERLLFTASQQYFSYIVYHGENYLLFNKMMSSALY
jgi:hypothetical protein